MKRKIIVIDDDERILQDYQKILYPKLNPYGTLEKYMNIDVEDVCKKLLNYY